jgi:parvulin-like peptidyl-prolyl isomerase
MMTLAISAETILHSIKLSCQIPDVVEAIATRKIIRDTAQQLGITIEREELQQAADSLRLAHRLIKAEDTWAWLQKHQLSLDGFEELAHINLLSAKLATHLFAAQVESFFFEHRLDFAAAAVYEVILDDEDMALELSYALREGEVSFQDIARQYIQEPELRRAGGYQGMQHRSDLRPEIAAVVFSAIPPQVLKPITTAKGVHLIWVEEIIHPQLDDTRRLKILGDLFSTWLKQQVEKMDITVRLEQTITSTSDQPASNIVSG